MSRLTLNQINGMKNESAIKMHFWFHFYSTKLLIDISRQNYLKIFRIFVKNIGKRADKHELEIESLNKARNASNVKKTLTNQQTNEVHVIAKR